MASKNNFKQLTVADKLTVIANLESTTLTSKRSLARQFDVDEATIRRIWQSRDMITGPPTPYGLNRQIMKINGCLLKYMINKLNTYRQKRVIKYLSKKLIKYIQLT